MHVAYRRPGRTLALALGLVVIGVAPALAQDVEVPVYVVAPSDESNPEEAGDDELDLANLVTSAAKSVTTVQEAPAIITIVSQDDLEQYQVRWLQDVGDLVPGFLSAVSLNGEFPFFAARGQIQSALMLRDSFSLFQPFSNVTSVHRGFPVETIKRIETISGPGGVLWGANSFLGVVNVITKDAEDIDGVEAGVQFADGRGDRSAYRAFAMAGLPRLFGHDDWGLVLHTSYERFQGQALESPQVVFMTPLPQPNSLLSAGPMATSDQMPSTMVNIDGKLTLGKVTLGFSVPYIEHYQALAFNAAPSFDAFEEDRLPECSALPAGTPYDSPDNNPGKCMDRRRASRSSQVGTFERFVTLDYKTRLGENAGLNTKLYAMQMVMDFSPLIVLNPSLGVLAGGLSLSQEMVVYKTGGSFDGDVQLGDKVRVLYGGEAIHDWVPDNRDRARNENTGIEVTFPAPYDLGRLPLLCPKTATGLDMNMRPTGTEFVEGCPLPFLYKDSTTTVGGYAAAQIRLSDKLILDGGARLQGTPQLSSTDRDFGLATTLSAAMVYELAPDWHLKLNYAEGFRPPVYNNTTSNGEAVSLQGGPDLATETSRSGQVEVNARLLKGRQRIRELDLRADYSYTVIDNFIGIIGGTYQNAGQRGIHSAEFLAKLYLKGGHRLQLGYTFNYIDTADRGAFHAYPNNWFHIAAVGQVIPDKLELSTVLKVYGALEDPNRRVDTTGIAPGENGQIQFGNEAQTVTVYAEEMVMDRLPSAAELQVGLRLKLLDERLIVQGTLYNVFDNDRGLYDQQSDLDIRLELIPHYFPGFRGFASATYLF